VESRLWRQKFFEKFRTMTKKEIYDLEQKNFGQIVLYLEGTFWIAYEHSAYWFYHIIKKYKLNKKHISAAGTEIVSLGFPAQSRPWTEIENVAVVEQETKRVVLSIPTSESSLEEFEYKFKEWKEDIGLAVPRERKITQPDNLPVYKAIYDLTLQVFKSSQHMKRDYRYSLGEKIKQECVDLTVMVYSANACDDKEPYIKEARRLIEVIRVQMRLLRDLGQIAIKHTAQIEFSIADITKQLDAWHKAAMNKKQN
jgi:hypothetical protein